MRTLAFSVVFSIGLAAAFGLLAQTPPAPIDNDEAHVIVAHDQPHKKGTAHQHKLDRVMIYLQAGRQEIIPQSGAPYTLEFKAGDVKWSPASGMHTSEIVSDTPVTIVEIEVKKPGDASKKITTPLDPLKVDPRDYKLEFQNEKVRVVRVHMGPNQGVPLHEHQMNRVVVYLTDQNGSMTTPDGQTTTAQHKAGEFSWGVPVKHKEQNNQSGPFEAIMVEFLN